MGQSTGKKNIAEANPVDRFGNSALRGISSAPLLNNEPAKNLQLNVEESFNWVSHYHYLCSASPESILDFTPRRFWRPQAGYIPLPQSVCHGTPKRHL